MFENLRETEEEHVIGDKSYQVREDGEGNRYLTWPHSKVINVEGDPVQIPILESDDRFASHPDGTMVTYAVFRGDEPRRIEMVQIRRHVDQGTDELTVGDQDEPEIRFSRSPGVTHFTVSDPAVLQGIQAAGGIAAYLAAHHSHPFDLGLIWSGEEMP